MASVECAEIRLELVVDELQLVDESSSTHDDQETRVTWRSEALEDTHVLLRSARPLETCAMFHLPIADVAVDGLGALWHDTRTHNAAQLVCGHVFHACALAVHFATNDMRCPVCRRGPNHRAQISSFAPAMQPALLRTKNEMHARADDNVSVDLDVDALARDFVFEVSPDTYFHTIAI
jgi:hypothetical protein